MLYEWYRCLVRPCVRSTRRNHTHGYRTYGLSRSSCRINVRMLSPMRKSIKWVYHPNVHETYTSGRNGSRLYVDTYRRYLSIVSTHRYADVIAHTDRFTDGMDGISEK